MKQVKAMAFGQDATQASAGFLQGTRDGWMHFGSSPQSIEESILTNLSRLGKSPDSNFGVEYALGYRQVIQDYAEIAGADELSGTIACCL